MTLKKKSYSLPALTELTREQAIKLVAQFKNCSENEAAEFLRTLGKHPPPNDEGRKRSA